MNERSVLAGSNPWATREGVRFAYWTGLLVALALLYLEAVEPPVRLTTGSLAWYLLLAGLAVSLVVAALTAVFGGSVLASVANPVAVVLGAVLASAHGVLVGATVPDLSPVAVVLLDAGWLLAAAIAGLLAFLVGAGIRRLMAALERPIGRRPVEKSRKGRS